MSRFGDRVNHQSLVGEEGSSLDYHGDCLENETLPQFNDQPIYSGNGGYALNLANREAFDPLSGGDVIALFNGSRLLSMRGRYSDLMDLSNVKIDPRSAHHLGIEELFSTLVENTESVFGSHFLFDSLVRQPFSVDQVLLRQEAVFECINNSSLRDGIGEFCRQSARLEEALLGYMLRPNIYNYRLLVGRLRNIGGLMEESPLAGRIQSSLLKELISDLQQFSKSDISTLIRGPIFRDSGKLRVRQSGSKRRLLALPFWPESPTDLRSVLFSVAGIAVVPTAVAGLRAALQNSGNPLPSTGLMVLGSMVGMLSLFVGGAMKESQDKNLFLEPLKELLGENRAANLFLNALGRLDEICAIARWSDKMPKGLPRSKASINAGAHYSFKACNLFSPLRLSLGKSCVATDVDLSEENLTVVTGPNSGGKTTSARTIGLTQALAGIGGPVFADRLECTLADRIFYLVPEQSAIAGEHGQLGDELLKVKAIADQYSSPRSLVLLDEFARGTSRNEGDEIAYRAIRSLRATGASVVWLTHNHEVAARLKKEGFGQVLMTELDNGAPTYKLRPGIAESSFAGSVVSQVKYPPDMETIERMEANNLARRTEYPT